VESIRTFIALILPEELKRSLGGLQAQFQQQSQGIKWVRPDSIHLTLKFLGDIRPDKVDPVCTVLSRLTQGCAPFAFEAVGIGAFPNERNPKVLWAGLAPDKRMADFQEKLDAGLAEIGFPREDRLFSPHLTLGRLRDGRSRKDIAALIERCGSKHLGNYQSDTVVFYKSDLRPAGPIHTALKEFTLKSA
jgi:2'-5' RNA ligase